MNRPGVARLDGTGSGKRAEMVEAPLAKRRSASRLSVCRLSAGRAGARPRRGAGGIRAHFEGWGSQARGHIDRALAINGNNAWAHAALGGWHLEIVHEGGLIGAAIYGASVRAGIEAYERTRAEEFLDRLLAREPRTALEGILRNSALPLKEALHRDDRAEIARLVAAGLGRRTVPKSDGAPVPGKR